jgi:hypothetical protein
MMRATQQMGVFQQPAHTGILIREGRLDLRQVSFLRRPQPGLPHCRKARYRFTSTKSTPGFIDLCILHFGH